MQLETLFKECVQKILKKRFGTAVWAVKIQMVALRGIPDMLLCVGGVFVAWELKVGNNKATALQQRNLAEIAMAGGVARVVTPENLEECLQELEALLLKQRGKV